MKRVLSLLLITISFIVLCSCDIINQYIPAEEITLNQEIKTDDYVYKIKAILITDKINMGRDILGSIKSDANMKFLCVVADVKSTASKNKKLNSIFRPYVIYNNKQEYKDFGYAEFDLGEYVDIAIPLKDICVYSIVQVPDEVANNSSKISLYINSDNKYLYKGNIENAIGFINSVEKPNKEMAQLTDELIDKCNEMTLNLKLSNNIIETLSEFHSYSIELVNKATLITNDFKNIRPPAFYKEDYNKILSIYDLLMDCFTTISSDIIMTDPQAYGTLLHEAVNKITEFFKNPPIYDNLVLENNIIKNIDG